jgi:hypothetical protein
MSRWVLHDAENCITDMLWTQATHKLPHVFLSKQAVIIGIRVAWQPLLVATVLQASAIRFVWLVCMAS